MEEGAWNLLRQAAIEARGRAYAPYSGFAVGAALGARDGTIFIGCNVENASYGATLCAERAALAAAVAAGKGDLVALAIASGATDPIPPCGICRQVLWELAQSLPIRSYAQTGWNAYELATLLPSAFGPRQLG